MNVLPLREPLCVLPERGCTREGSGSTGRVGRGRAGAGQGVGGMNGGLEARALVRRWEGRRTEVVDIPSRRETGCWDHADPSFPPSLPGTPDFPPSTQKTETTKPIYRGNYHLPIFPKPLAFPKNRKH